MKKIVISIAVVVIGALLYGSYLWFKPHTNVSRTKALRQFSANELFLHLEENGLSPEYFDQVISVEGEVIEVDLSNDKSPQIVLETGLMDAYIRCGFEQENKEQLSNVVIGNTLKIKGILKGINDADGLDLLVARDVIVSKCIIIE